MFYVVQSLLSESFSSGIAFIVAKAEIRNLVQVNSGPNIIVQTVMFDSNFIVSIAAFLESLQQKL